MKKQVSYQPFFLFSLVVFRIFKRYTSFHASFVFLYIYLSHQDFQILWGSYYSLMIFILCYAPVIPLFIHFIVFLSSVLFS